MCKLEYADGSIKKKSCYNSDEVISSPLIPGNYVLPRTPSCQQQRPSKNVIGQMGFFCTDNCTPVFAHLVEELSWDAAVVQHAVAVSLQSDDGTNDQLSKTVAYALTTHPGHHAAYDSFGAYCYVNNAALAARLFQESGYSKVAILDVDYHCGNGTASIFYDDATVFVASIHCHPDMEYPFHSGFCDEKGANEGFGMTLHVPLMPGTTWKEYSIFLQRALEGIIFFGAEALVVSLGLDTHEGDPCAIRRAGFNLKGNDYFNMGQMIASRCYHLPTIVLQEGGYKMDKVPRAATDFLLGCTKGEPCM